MLAKSMRGLLLTCEIACMRMRKLGRGQSVVFCIPRDIEQKIQAQRDPKSATGDISVSDVLCWAISETWRDLRRMVPLWLTQGVRYYEQEALWNEGENVHLTRKHGLKSFLSLKLKTSTLAIDQKLALNQLSYLNGLGRP